MATRLRSQIDRDIARRSVTVGIIVSIIVVA